MEGKKTMIQDQKLSNVYTYSAYRTLIDGLFAEGKSTGDNHSEAMMGYTKLNIHRMKRLDKTVVLTDHAKEQLALIKAPQRWVVLTEAWCGDAAQNIPIMVAMANENPLIQLDVILRDQNLDFMDQYLTNGGRSIPKLVMFDDKGEELGEWGPRPTELQQMVLDNKYGDNPIPYSEFSKTIQMWYNKDKGVSAQKEIACLVTECNLVF